MFARLDKYLAALLMVMTSGLCLSAYGCDEFVRNVTPFIKDYPPYSSLESDSDLKAKFDEYIRWLAGLKVPDAEFVLKFIDSKVTTVEALSLIHHEKVEFREWLRLGHKFEDVLNLDYYRAHYEEVYPIAHSRAVRSEMGLLKHYAIRRGFPRFPELAFALVTPMVEQWHSTVDSMMRRIRYNPELKDQAPSVSRRDLNMAASVYLDGGYRYVNRRQVIEEAERFLSAPVPP